MKLVFTIVSFAVASALLTPPHLVGQERVDRFSSALLEARSLPVDLSPAASAYIEVNRTKPVVGAVVGGLTGLALGAGIGYLMYRDSTAGCDDGLCGWVPPAVIGGGTGLLIGSWLGYRIVVGPRR